MTPSYKFTIVKYSRELERFHMRCSIEDIKGMLRFMSYHKYLVGGVGRCGRAGGGCFVVEQQTREYFGAKHKQNYVPFYRQINYKRVAYLLTRTAVEFA